MVKKWLIIFPDTSEMHLRSIACLLIMLILVYRGVKGQKSQLVNTNF